VLAGALCVLAFASKLSAVWGAIAILIWLFVRDRSRLPLFMVSSIGCAAVLLGVFEVASGGRMTDNVLHLAVAGESHIYFVAFVTKAVNIGRTSGAIWVLLPIAIVSVAAAVPRRLTIYHIAFVVALVVVIAVLTDIGASENHFIDVDILTGAVVAYVWRMTPATDVVRAIVLAAVLFGTLTSYATDVSGNAQSALRSLTGRNEGYEKVPLAGVVRPGDRVLSEDPYIPVSRGQDPVVLDAFMLRRIARDHADWQSALIREIDAHRFTTRGALWIPGYTPDHRLSRAGENVRANRRPACVGVPAHQALFY
jgi:hypothetical protein